MTQSRARKGTPKSKRSLKTTTLKISKAAESRLRQRVVERLSMLETHGVEAVLQEIVTDAVIVATGEDDADPRWFVANALNMAVAELPQAIRGLLENSSKEYVTAGHIQTVLAALE